MAPELAALGVRTVAIRRASPWDFRDAAVLVRAARAVCWSALAIKRLVRLPKLAQQLAANGRRRAERNFGVRFQVEETISWYEELLAPPA